MTEIYGVRVVTYLYVLCTYVCMFLYKVHLTICTHRHTHTHTYTYTRTYLGPVQLNHDTVSQWVRKEVVRTLLVARTPYALIYTLCTN